MTTTADGDLVVETHVGTGLFDFGHRDGDAADALLQHPLGVTELPDGSVAVSDTYNGAVRRFDPATGQVSTLAQGLAEPSDAVVEHDPETGEVRLVVVESAAHRLTRVALPEAAQRVDGPAHRTQRPPTPLPAGEVALEVTFVPPAGQKLDFRWGDPTRLDVSATPDALLVSGRRAGRGPDPDARAARRHRVGHAAHLGAGRRVRRRPRDGRGARARRLPPLPAGLGDPGHPRPDRRCHTDSRPPRGPGRATSRSDPPRTTPSGRRRQTWHDRHLVAAAAPSSRRCAGCWPSCCCPSRSSASGPRCMLTRTDVFVEELRPVVAKPQVQEALTDGVVQGVLGAVDLQPAIEKALEAPIRTQAAALVASPQVAAAWTTGIRAAAHPVHQRHGGPCRHRLDDQGRVSVRGDDPRPGADLHARAGRSSERRVARAGRDDPPRQGRRPAERATGIPHRRRLGPVGAARRGGAGAAVHRARAALAHGDDARGPRLDRRRHSRSRSPSWSRASRSCDASTRRWRAPSPTPPNR